MLVLGEKENWLKVMENLGGNLYEPCLISFRFIKFCKMVCFSKSLKTIMNVILTFIRNAQLPLSSIFNV